MVPRRCWLRALIVSFLDSPSSGSVICCSGGGARRWRAAAWPRVGVRYRQAQVEQRPKSITRRRVRSSVVAFMELITLPANHLATQVAVVGGDQGRAAGVAEGQHVLQQ